MLSSRKFLNLIERLPEASQFKTHAAAPFGRYGDWTEFVKMVAALHNETAANRASKFAGGEHEYEYTVFLSPLERRERAEEAEAEEAFQGDEFERLMTNLGNT
jgi:hypothetical protein